MSHDPQSNESVFSKHQLRHFNELQSEVRRAQEQLQGFIDYLGEEHELDPNKKWVIGPRGFIEASPEQMAQAQQMAAQQLPPVPQVPTAKQNGHPEVESGVPARDEG